MMYLDMNNPWQSVLLQVAHKFVVYRSVVQVDAKIMKKVHNPLHLRAEYSTKGLVGLWDLKPDPIRKPSLEHL